MNTVGVSREGTRRAGPNSSSWGGLLLLTMMFTFSCNDDGAYAPSVECEGKKCNSTNDGDARTSDDKSKGKTADSDETATDASGGRDTRETSAGESTSGETDVATTDGASGKSLLPTYAVCDPVTEKGCGGEAPWCLGEGEQGADGGLLVEPRCVECEEDAHCEFPYVETGNAGVCIDNVCVCDTETHRGCGGETPACSQRASGKRRCVECTSDEHCTSPAASRCDVEMNLCVPCSDVGQCAHLSETPACDVSRGRCVECTTDEDMACEGRACNAVKGSDAYQTCSEFEKGSTLVCGECVSDEQCAEGHKCVGELMGGYQIFSLGRRHCMPLGNAESCSNNRPFTTVYTTTSLGGVKQGYCHRVDLSCKQFTLYGSGPDVIPDGTPGAGRGTCADDSSCADPLRGDGRCIDFEPNVKACTYYCRDDDSCPASASCVEFPTPDGSSTETLCYGARSDR